MDWCFVLVEQGGWSLLVKDTPLSCTNVWEGGWGKCDFMDWFVCY